MIGFGPRGAKHSELDIPWLAQSGPDLRLGNRKCGK
jgi:hypothetical protein